MRTGLNCSRREAASNIFDSANHEETIWTPIGRPLALVPNRIVIAGLPGSATWAIGLLVGINLLFGGATLIGVALAAHAKD